MDFLTPIIKLDYKKWGYNIYVKREDLLPFSFGGNKARIANEFFSDMAKKGRNCIVGYGNSRSNLSRVLTNMASKKNIPCHIISPSDEDGSRLTAMNEKIVNQCGGIIHYCSKNNVSETIEKVINQCKLNNYSPYYIYGNKYGQGNESVPVRAYANVYKEIIEQANSMKLNFDVVFLATGTGMTQAGLIAGRQIMGNSERIIGISVARNKELELDVLKKYISSYFLDNNINVPMGNIEILDDYIFGGYGRYNEKIERTIEKVMRYEGIPLDPTYTGKAFTGMLDVLAKQHITGNVLFLHTGGTPGFFDFLNQVVYEYGR